MPRFCVCFRPTPIPATYFSSWWERNSGRVHARKTYYHNSKELQYDRYMVRIAVHLAQLLLYHYDSDGILYKHSSSTAVATNAQIAARQHSLAAKTDPKTSINAATQTPLGFLSSYTLLSHVSANQVLFSIREVRLWSPYLS